MDQETTIPTRDSRIMVSAAEVIGIDDMSAKIEDITAAISATDEEAIAAIERAVPTYHYTVHEA